MASALPADAYDAHGVLVGALLGAELRPLVAPAHYLLDLAQRHLVVRREEERQELHLIVGAGFGRREAAAAHPRALGAGVQRLPRVGRG